MVKVEVEYCGQCNFEKHCKELEKLLQSEKPNTEIVCFLGRPGSFEIKIDDTLVYSKLQSYAFPNQESILENVDRKEKGLPLVPVSELQEEKCILL